MYLLLDTYVKDSAQKVHLFPAIDNISFIAIFRKAFFPQTWHLYKKTESSFLTLGEVDVSWDLSQRNSLTAGERYFIIHVIAVFFTIEDGIILENLASRFMNEVQVPQVLAFYSFQIAMKNVHSEMCSLLLDT
ncbi:putative ribonucleoside-diphosphate reductase small chain B, partial [Mucuna pruriens]